MDSRVSGHPGVKKPDGLTGSIPNSFGNLTKLTTLNIYQNKLSGPIPRELCYNVNLQVLDLRNKSLTGSIPKWLREFDKNHIVIRI